MGGDGDRIFSRMKREGRIRPQTLRRHTAAGTAAGIANFPNPLQTLKRLPQCTACMEDRLRELKNLERRHDAIMVAISEMRARIDRQKSRALGEFESYHTLEKQAAALYDAEAELADMIRRFKNEHGLA